MRALACLPEYVARAPRCPMTSFTCSLAPWPREPATRWSSPRSVCACRPRTAARASSSPRTPCCTRWLPASRRVAALDLDDPLAATRSLTRCAGPCPAPTGTPRTSRQPAPLPPGRPGRPLALDCQPPWRGRGLPAPGRALRLRPAPHGHRRGTAEAGCPPRPGRGSTVLNRGAGGRPAARRARRHWRLRRTRRRPPARGRCPAPGHAPAHPPRACLLARRRGPRARARPCSPSPRQYCPHMAAWLPRSSCVRSWWTSVRWTWPRLRRRLAGFVHLKQQRLSVSVVSSW